MSVPRVSADDDLHCQQVSVASVGSFIGLADTGIYNASKHAVRGLTRTAAREYGRNNIRVNAVAPGTSSTCQVRTRSHLLIQCLQA